MSQYQVVVFGATSFVGQILARYLFQRHGANGSFRWALAGRSKGKLEQVRDSLGADAATLPLLIADAADSAALRKLCEATDVVISTVGPLRALWLAAGAGLRRDGYRLLRPHWRAAVDRTHDRRARADGPAQRRAHRPTAAATTQSLPTLVCISCSRSRCVNSVNPAPASRCA